MRKWDRQLPAVSVGGSTQHFAKNRELQEDVRWWWQVTARSARIKRLTNPGKARPRLMRKSNSSHGFVRDCGCHEEKRNRVDHKAGRGIERRDEQLCSGAAKLIVGVWHTGSTAGGVLFGLWVVANPAWDCLRHHHRPNWRRYARRQCYGCQPGHW